MTDSEKLDTILEALSQQGIALTLINTDLSATEREIQKALKNREGKS